MILDELHRHPKYNKLAPESQRLIKKNASCGAEVPDRLLFPCRILECALTGKPRLFPKLLLDANQLVEF